MKKLDRREIGRLLRRGKDFEVPSRKERKHALDGATFLGIDITTRRLANGAYWVIFI